MGGREKWLRKSSTGGQTDLRTIYSQMKYHGKTSLSNKHTLKQWKAVK
jgi:hypothetical protein